MATESHRGAFPMTEQTTEHLSTYVRKTRDGQFEYGYVRRSANFRKWSDEYRPIGTSPTAGEAEAKREQLAGR